LCFEYSDLRANYPTHDMLIPSKTYAVKTIHPHIQLMLKQLRTRKSKAISWVFNNISIAFPCFLTILRLL
jgi:hypothetical protein